MQRNWNWVLLAENLKSRCDFCNLNTTGEQAAGGAGAQAGGVKRTCTHLITDKKVISPPQSSFPWGILLNIHRNWTEVCVVQQTGASQRSPAGLLALAHPRHQLCKALKTPERSELLLQLCCHTAGAQYSTFNTVTKRGGLILFKSVYFISEVCVFVCSLL